MSYLITKNNKILTITLKFIMIALIAVSLIKCKHIIPHLIDGEVKLFKVNDSIYFDEFEAKLLLDVSNKEGMFLKISDNVDSLSIQKNNIYVRSNGQYFVYSNDTISEIKNENVKGINFKPIDFYILSE
jgi:hypothetical protein